MHATSLESAESDSNLDWHILPLSCMRLNPGVREAAANPQPNPCSLTEAENVNYGRGAVDLDHSLSWLALRLTPGLGARLTGKLLRQFGGPEEIFRASLTELEGCQLPAAAAQAVFGKSGFRDAEKELEQVKKAGIRLITWAETEYPKLLAQIYDPPPLLYVRGNVEVLSRHAISMVGTRRPTPYGNQITERLARDLAERGLVIVSGLARGIDS
jgi:DNA processing protein